MKTSKSSTVSIFDNSNFFSHAEIRAMIDNIKKTDYWYVLESVVKEDNVIAETVWCERCNGSGILNFGFYTRECECQLK
jgi:hypothetical protein